MDISPAMLDAAQRGEVGVVVRLARRRASWTQAELAAAIGYSQTAVSRIEREAGSNAHDVRTLRMLARALDIPGTLLGIAVGAGEEDPLVRRRDFLRVASVGVAAMASGDVLGPGRVGRSDIVDLQRAIDDLRSLDQQVGGDRLRHLAAMHVRRVRTLLDHGDYNAGVGTDLSSSARPRSCAAGCPSTRASTSPRHEVTPRPWHQRAPPGTSWSPRTPTRT